MEFCREIDAPAPVILDEAACVLVLASSGRAAAVPANSTAAALWLEAGSLLVCRGAMEITPASDCHLLVIGFSGEAARQAGDKLTEPLLSDCSACPLAAQEMSALAAAVSRGESELLPALAFRALCSVVRADEAPESPGLPPLVAQAVLAIRQNYAGLYGVDELAAASAAQNIGAQMPDGEKENATLQAVLGTLAQTAQVHAENTGNPHAVTAGQAGAYTKEETEARINAKVVEIGAGDMAQAEYGGSAPGVVKAADRLSAARSIGSAPFDGSADVTLAQMGALSDDVSEKVVSTQYYAEGSIRLYKSGRTVCAALLGVRVNQALPVGSEYTLGAIIPEGFAPLSEFYKTQVSASTGTRYNLAWKPDGSLTIQPLNASGEAGDVFYDCLTWIATA